jgi:hypothetical chaperone protein
MKAVLGIDFGTTNSTVCLFDGTDYHFADLEDGKQTIPTLMYVDREFSPTYGESARTRFLHDNMDRRIKLEKTDLGYIEITLSEGSFNVFENSGVNPVPVESGIDVDRWTSTFDAKISSFTDQELPGFLFASTKRLLGRAMMDSVRLFSKKFKLEAIVSSIIQNILSKMKSGHSHVETLHICVGRPVNYECALENKQGEYNALASERMDKALEYTGIGKYSYFLEPIAPVLAHVHEYDEEENQNLLVLDFGGGTLDLSIIEKRKNRLQVVGNFGRALGGDIINEKLISDYILPKLGLSRNNLTELRSRNNFLGEIIPDILNWRTTYLLNQPKYFTLIADAMKLLPQEAEHLNRIRLLVTKNFSYNVFYAIETAKKRLSESLKTTVELRQIGITFPLSQTDLKRSLHDYLATIESSIESFCTDTGYQTGQIGRVLLTGGTSLIPCINKRIQNLFPDKVIKTDPFLSVVKGIALSAWLESKNKISLNADQYQIDLT